MPQKTKNVKGRRAKKGKRVRRRNPCEKCIPAKCCMYYSIEIDEPEDKQDYDDLLWIIAHKETELYVSEDRWYLLVKAPCRFYDPTMGCLIYPKRPRICRSHSTGECEFDDEYDFDMHFHSYEEFERYVRNNT